MPTLNQKLTSLENQIKGLESALSQLQAQLTKTVLPSPINNTIGHSFGSRLTCDSETKLGAALSGKIVWNDSELAFLMGTGQYITTPTVGYHKHSHSRYAGGALDISTLELVEYEPNSELNPHSQSYWGTKAKIKKMEKYNSGAISHSLGGQLSENVASQVEKIGKLALIFNPNNSQWGAVAYAIDIKNCYFAEYDKYGNIAKDENDNEKKSPLWNSDSTKTSIVWDKNAQCWRLYAVYAEEPEVQ